MRLVLVFLILFLYLVHAQNKPPTRTRRPTRIPTKAPTKIPTRAPTKFPTRIPTRLPTRAPTRLPTKAPTRFPTPLTRSPTLTPTLSPTNTPTLSPTEAPTTPPTTAFSALCSNLIVDEQFQEFPSSIFKTPKNNSCNNAGISSGNGSLILKLGKGCGAARLVSALPYNGGYFEADLRIGGKGGNFTGVVYAWYLRECDNGQCPANEIDFEWLGRPSKKSTQTNWYYNSTGEGINEIWSDIAPVAPLYNEFAKYSIFWNDSKIEWFINDQKVRSVAISDSQVYTSRPMYMFISIWEWAGNSWAGTVNWSSPAINDYFMEFRQIKICSL